MDFVQVFAALLTKVFIWRALGAEDADTCTMLPDLADIALYKETCDIFGELNGSENVGVGSLDRWSTGIVLGATKAADGFVLLLWKLVTGCHYVKNVLFRSLLDLVVMIALSSSAEECVVKILQWLG